MSLLEVFKQVKAADAEGPLFSASASEKRRAQAVYDAWMKRYSRNGVFSERATITPALAEVILERNPANRKISEVAVRRYATDMSDGRWQFNGETIIIDKDGMLNDGQHRCHSAILSGASFDTLVAVGVERESRETLNTGKIRIVADHLQMKGHVDANNLGYAARTYWQLQTFGRTHTSSDRRPTQAQINETIEDHPGLVESLKYGHKARKARIGPVGLMAGLKLWLGERDPSADQKFFQPLVAAIGFAGKYDPAYLLHKRLVESDRQQESERTLLIFKAWNAYRTHAPIRLLKIVPGEEFPKAE